MCSKAHTALTAPLVLHHTRIYKYSMKKFGFNCQMRNEPFLLVIYHSSLVKGAMNAVRLCKLCNGVKKRLNFFYFQWKKVNQVRSEYLRSYLNWLHNWQLKSTRCSHTLGTGEFCSNTHATLPLSQICRMSLISAGSFSLDSTFRVNNFLWTGKIIFG